MAGNMEDMLMGGSDDDDSSGDEAEVESGNALVPAAASIAAAAAAAAATATTAAPPKPAPVPGAAAAAPPAASEAAPRKGAGKDLAAARARAAAAAKAAAAAAASAKAAPPPAAAAPASAPAAAVPPQPASAAPNTAAAATALSSGAAAGIGQGESEISRRLKSLYSPAAAQARGAGPAVAAAAQAPAGPPSALPGRPSGTGKPQQQPPAAAAAAAATGTLGLDIEPTPLNTLIQKEQAKHHQHRSQQQRQQQQRRTSGHQPDHSQHMQQQQQRRGSNTSGGASVSSAASSSTANTPNLSSLSPQQQQQGGSSGGSRSSSHVQHLAEMEAKRRKEKFLMFTRVLMKYLESKDKDMHARAKDEIKHCAEMNKKGDPSYASLTASMSTRLRKVVGENYWRKAEDYLNHFVKGKKETAKKQQQQRALQLKGQQALDMGGSTGGSASSPSSVQAQAAARLAAAHKRANQQAAAAAAQGGRSSSPMDVDLPAPAAAREKPAKTKTTKSSKSKSKASSGGGAAGSQQEKRAQQKQEKEEAQKKKAKREKQKKQAAMRSKQAEVMKQQAMDLQAKQAKQSTVRGKSPLTTLAAASRDMDGGPPPKDIAQLMEYLDHAVRYDQASAAVLLSREYKDDIDLSAEQKKLLFGDNNSFGKVKRSPAAEAAEVAGGGGEKAEAEAPAPFRGWSKRNVVSARSAWAKVRLPENDILANPTSERPALPGEKPAQAGPIEPKFEWFNEAKVEDDETLTLLSEATEMYLRSVLEGSINVARQRQNIDGIRLWYQQHNAGKKAPLSLRLGCDVRRQEALATGNAAMTVKRMEEALERQRLPQNERNLGNDETLYKAGSMSDLAKRPRLARAPERAEYDAKRSFEQYGGKDSAAPPLGRVPKKAKIGKKDISSCLQDPSFPWKPKRTSVR